MPLKLYHAVGACSRVTMAALEEIGVPYDDESLDLFAGAQKDPAFTALNPKGKVPLLIVDNFPITETPSILNYLSARYPDAQLLPRSSNAAADARGLSDLIWCAGALHPILHRFFRSKAYSVLDESGVRENARKQLQASAAQVEARISSGHLYDNWSIVDNYLTWIFKSAETVGFDLTPYPRIGELIDAVNSRAAYARTLAREQAATTRQIGVATA